MLYRRYTTTHRFFFHDPHHEEKSYWIIDIPDLAATKVTNHIWQGRSRSQFRILGINLHTLDHGGIFTKGERDWICLPEAKIREESRVISLPSIRPQRCLPSKTERFQQPSAVVVSGAPFSPFPYQVTRKSRGVSCIRLWYISSTFPLIFQYMFHAQGPPPHGGEDWV